MTLDTADDRTLFFDTLPLVFRSGNLKVKLKLFTVPGQVMHNSTRRIVLQGADAIAFIADSQPSKRQENYRYWLNMVENLKSNGLDAESMPNVVQWNKKDLGDSSCRSTPGVGEERAHQQRAVEPGPDSCAAAKRFWLPTLYSSTSRWPMPYFTARFSAVIAMGRPL